mmetsp:Transcript_1889/g.4687  ORF Transcript_1889/g.4687 Transcript_1889/m.4687 type:complete len:403 (-) Transcript_1889:768-1976(-)
MRTQRRTCGLSAGGGSAEQTGGGDLAVARQSSRVPAQPQRLGGLAEDVNGCGCLTACVPPLPRRQRVRARCAAAVRRPHLELRIGGQRVRPGCPGATQVVAVLEDGRAQQEDPRQEEDTRRQELGRAQRAQRQAGDAAAAGCGRVEAAEVRQPDALHNRGAQRPAEAALHDAHARRRDAEAILQEGAQEGGAEAVRLRVFDVAQRGLDIRPVAAAVRLAGALEVLQGSGQRQLEKLVDHVEAGHREEVAPGRRALCAQRARRTGALPAGRHHLCRQLLAGRPVRGAGQGDSEQVGGRRGAAACGPAGVLAREVVQVARLHAGVLQQQRAVLRRGERPRIRPQARLQQDGDALVEGIVHAVALERVGVERILRPQHLDPHFLVLGRRPLVGDEGHLEAGAPQI